MYVCVCVGGGGVEEGLWRKLVVECECGGMVWKLQEFWLRSLFFCSGNSMTLTLSDTLFEPSCFASQRF